MAPKYQALDTDRSIRLLTLQPASTEDDTVSCTLTVHVLDRTIAPFTALSYTWGSSKDPKRIRVNGFDTDVTPNLYGALVHLRDAEHAQVLWIDALCINQRKPR